MRLLLSDGRIYNLSRPFITVGRSATRDIVIPDPRISRHHAVLRQHSESYILSDVGSANGTYVNGNRIENPIVLQHGDSIRMGTITLLFQHEQYLDYEPVDRPYPQSFDEPLTGLEGAQIDLLDIPMTPATTPPENALSSAKTEPLDDPNPTIKDIDETSPLVKTILYDMTLGIGEKRLIRRLVRKGTPQSEAESLVRAVAKKQPKFATTEVGKQARAERAMMQMVPAGLLFLIGLLVTTLLYIITDLRWWYWFLWLAVALGAAGFLRAFYQWLKTR